MKQNYNSYLPIFSFMYTQSEQQLDIPSCYHADKAELRREEQDTGSAFTTALCLVEQLLQTPSLLHQGSQKAAFPRHVPPPCILVATPSTSSPSLVLCFSSTAIDLSLSLLRGFMLELLRERHRSSASGPMKTLYFSILLNYFF